MTVIKIMKIKRCLVCPNAHYTPTGKYRCDYVGILEGDVEKIGVFPEDCPLGELSRGGLGDNR
jgi:hypothetical protein